MRAVFKLTDRDKGWQQLKRTVESLKQGGSFVKIGMLGEKAAKVEHEDEGGEPLTNVLLMLFHEFGTEHVPERSVIRRVFELHQADNLELLRKLVKGIYEGRITPQKVLEVMGQRIKWQMKNFMLEGQVTPPLAPSTIRAKRRKGKWNKGVDKEGNPIADREPIPLVDTGRLAAAIDHLVVIQNREQPSAAGTTEEERGSATLVAEEEP